MQQLPELVLFRGDWAGYEEELYQHYRTEIVNGHLQFKGLPIRCQYRPPYKGKHSGFWHTISTGEVEDDRLPDLRRCEHIRWVRWMIENFEKDSRISWWENKRGNSTHVVLFLEAENYAIILAKRTNYYLLKTSYCVEPHRKKRLVQERVEFWKRQKS